MQEHEGRCLCGGIRYRVTSQPVRVTFCHCRFCQRSSGAAYAVEPIFNRSDFSIVRGTAATYQHCSEESGKILTVSFCSNCGTKMVLDFERFPDVCGVYAGTFDDPNWFSRAPEVARHIFLESAQQGTVIPAGMPAIKNTRYATTARPLNPKFSTSRTLSFESSAFPFLTNRCGSDC